LCFGYVGTGGRRFCLKPLKGIASTCGVSKHGAKFTPRPEHFYLGSNDVTAFCEPLFPMTLVPDDLRGEIQSDSKMIEEWKALFADFLQQAEEEVLEEVSANRYLFPNPAKFQLKTPEKNPFFDQKFPAVTIPRELEAIRQQAEVLSDDQHWWDEDETASLLPTSLFTFLKHVRGFLIKYDKWLEEPLDILTLRFGTVEGDLHKLKLNCETLQLALGRPLSLNDNDFPDLWSAIEFLFASIKSTEASEGFLISLKQLAWQMDEIMLKCSAWDNSSSRMDSIESLLKAHESLLQRYDSTLKMYEGRFQGIQPLLLSIRDLKAKLNELELNIERCNAPIPSSPNAPDPWMQSFVGGPTSIPLSPPSVSNPILNAAPIPSACPDAEARLRTLEQLVKSLEKRIVGDGIRIGRFLFQSQEDLRVWLLAHVPSNRFGLFLDGVSIFDFLAQPHTDSQENMSHLYNTQKNGFDTVYEARIVSSMQNLFPNLFGKGGSDGMDTSKTLPAIQSIEKWNSNGVTGLLIQVEWELPNIDLQFRNAIASTFDDSPEARDLALELLYRSKKFALDLCNFMQRDFDFWKHKSYSKQDAWELTCLSVRRIFEDIHVVRVVGRDSRDLKNPSLTATQILWATLRSHLVMEEYCRRNFYEHPSISAVIARHLASHQT
jgi:hypothetical protein